MTLTRVKPADWSTGETLTSAQMNAIDVQLPYALDGNAGGTYAPSGQIIIGGSGFACTGASSFSNCTAFTLAGNMTISGSRTITATNTAATFSSCTAGEITGTSIYTSNLVNLSAPVTVVRVQPLTPIFNGVNGGGDSSLGTSGGWVFNAAGDFFWEGGGDNLSIPLTNLVDNSTLTAVTLRVSGSSSGCTAKLYTDDNSASATLLESQADSGSGVRNLTITVSPAVTIDMTSAPRSLYVYLDGPASGYRVHRLTATFAATKINP